MADESDTCTSSSDDEIIIQKVHKTQQSKDGSETVENKTTYTVIPNPEESLPNLCNFNSVGGGDISFPEYYNYNYSKMCIPHGTKDISVYNTNTVKVKAILEHYSLSFNIAS